MTIYIRTDSNFEIGTGHLMRCLSIANFAKKQNIDCTFITADNNSNELLKKNNFTPICLNSIWNDLDKETDKMLALIQEKQIKNLLIDSYFVTEKYMSALKEKTRVIYIDDLNNFIYPCDVLINYAIYWDKFDYENRYPKETKLLLGCNYTPLREQFNNLPEKKISKEIEKILIMTGGTDNYNVSVGLLEAFLKIKEFKTLNFKVICGIFNNNRYVLKEYSKRFHNIEIIESTDNIAPLMCWADLAISAAGTTLYELCACGTPTICFTLANNQFDNAVGFEENGMVIYAGDVRKKNNNVFNNIIYEFRHLSYEKRTLINKSMSKKINAKGAFQIILDSAEKVV